VEIELKLGGVGIEVEVEGVRGVAAVLGVAAVVAAVVRELRTPPEHRTWHGRLADVVPYDLRVPTVARLRASMWDEANPSLLAPTAFGVGWTVNLAALGERLGMREAVPERTGEAEPEPAH
jgi:hypothetical protein